MAKIIQKYVGGHLYNYAAITLLGGCKAQISAAGMYGVFSK